jgi:endonuclease III related protein
MKRGLLLIYNILFIRFGEQHWWPGDTPFEVCVGAILTQSTSWSNVEKAINNLKKEDMLSPEKLNDIETKKLAKLIRPAGYFNAKARKLKEFTNYLTKNHNNDLDRLFSQPIPKLREELLSIWGIGPETADSIILYAAEKPGFVVDAYTKRIFHRLGFTPEKIDYENLKKFSENNLPRDTQVYNEFHALIVRLGKEHCKKTKPQCGDCPIKKSCKQKYSNRKR